MKWPTLRGTLESHVTLQLLALSSRRTITCTDLAGSARPINAKILSSRQPILAPKKPTLNAIEYDNSEIGWGNLHAAHQPLNQPRQDMYLYIQLQYVLESINSNTTPCVRVRARTYTQVYPAYTEAPNTGKMNVRLPGDSDQILTQLVSNL